MPSLRALVAGVLCFVVAAAALTSAIIAAAPAIAVAILVVGIGWVFWYFDLPGETKKPP